MRTLMLVLLVGCSHHHDSFAPVPASDHEMNLAAIDPRFASAMLASYSKHAQPTAPLSLTPTDGSELALTALKADIAIEGPLAHTELHMTFHNTEPRQREGRFQITLPPDAAIGRFAMRVDGTWREAHVVARERGEQMFETYLHQRVDPALLEQDHGNGFSARVFPIPPNGDKEIIIAYDHRVSNAAPYRLALRGLPKTQKLTIDLAQDGAMAHRVLDGRVPDDVVVEPTRGDVAVAAGDSFVARVELGDTPDTLPLDNVLILVDTSASRAGVMARQTEVVDQLVSSLPGKVIVAAYDQDVTELYRGAARDAHDVGSALLRHGALGASDLGTALAMAAVADVTRVIIIGDGTPTLGEHRAGVLAKWMNAMMRVDAIQVGQSIDRATLAPIVAAGHNAGAILDANHLRGLSRVIEPDQRVRVVGALQTWPATTRGLAPGEPVFVVGKRTGSNEPLEIHVGARVVKLAASAAMPEHVERAVAIAQVAELDERLALASDAERPEVMHDLEQLGTKFGLVTAATSMIVLENDVEEKRQFGTAQRHHADVRDPDEAVKIGEDHNEAIQIHGSAPIIDQGSTKTGVTITQDYLQNIPVPGRTFSNGLGTDGPTGAISQGASPEWNVAQMTRRAMHEKQPAAPEPRPSVHEPEPAHQPPYTAEMEKVMTALDQGDRRTALEIASAWQLANPGDIAALIGLGEALEARGSLLLAERAYTSIIDLYPRRSELVRAAAERLDRIPGARALAIDAYRRALRERPDQISTYRLLAYDLMREHDAAALALIDTAIKRNVSRHTSFTQILAADRATIAAYLKGKSHGASVRIVLTWETDGNDVDLHVHDRHDNHSWYGHFEMDSGGTLLEDVTDGFGPEMFIVKDPTAFPYVIGAHYFSRGPEGIGLGCVQVIRDDGEGTISIDDRPFMIQNDHAYVELGTIAE